MSSRRAICMCLIILLAIIRNVIVVGDDETIVPAPKNWLPPLRDVKTLAKLTKYRYDDTDEFSYGVIKIREYHSNLIEMGHFVHEQASNNMSQAAVNEFYSLDPRSIISVERSPIWSCRTEADAASLLGRIFLTGKEPVETSSLLALFSSEYDESLSKDLARPPKHLLGLTRLLYLLSANHDKLHPLGIQLYTQSILTDVYTMHLASPRASMNTKLVALQVHFIASQNTDTHFPIRIILVVDHRDYLMIDITNIGPIDYEKIQSDGEELQLDLFTIDPRFGCAETLSVMNRAGPDPAGIPRVASMRFEAVDLLTRQKDRNAVDRASTYDKQFVAYDGHQLAFRRDVLRKKSQDESSVRRDWYSITIHDLKRARKYNVQQDGCVMLQTESSLYEPLFPYLGFSYLGTAKVRGIQAEVYEHQSAGHLPAVFFPQSTYISISGQYMGSENEQYDTMGKTLLVVYYFATQSKNGDQKSNRSITGPLLRLDLFIEHTGEHLSRIEVFDFAWHLRSAPNGDSPEKLFTITQQCLEANQLEGEIRLQLELRNRQNLHGTCSMDTESDRERARDAGNRRVYELLERNPQDRNRALMGSLAVQTKLSIVQLGDLRSELRWLDESAHRNSTLRIYTSIRFNQLSRASEMYLYQPLDVGAQASPRRYANPTESATYEECFFEAAHLRRRGTRPVLFAFITGCCYIDAKPIYEIDRKTGRLLFTYSNELNLDRIRINRDENSNRAMDTPSRGRIGNAKQIILEKLNTWHVQNMSDSLLRGKIIIVPLPKIDDRGRKCDNNNNNNTHPCLTTATFEVIDVQIVERKRSPVSSGLLSGLSVNKGKKPAMPSSEFGLQENLAYCHFSCLGDLDCGSFSLCLRADSSVECLLSDLNLADSVVLKQIEVERSANPTKIKKSLLNGRLSIDKHCTSYAKNPLELFDEVSRRTVVINLGSSGYVSSIEECASKCLELSNLKPLGGVRWDETKESSGSMGEQHKSRADISKWCISFEYAGLEQIAPNIPPGHSMNSILSLDKKNPRQEGGVCLLRRGEANSLADDKVNNLKVETDVRMYEFKFEYLFEAQQNVRLISPSANPESKDDLSLSRDRQKFLQIPNVGSCAQACLMMVEPTPVCKSFDFYVIRTPTFKENEIDLSDPIATGGKKHIWQKHFTTRNLCAINFMTLAEAKQNNLSNDAVIFGQPNEFTSVWHYEPRGIYPILIGSHRVDKSPVNSEDGREQSSHRLRFIASIIVVPLLALAGLVSGLFAALKAGQLVLMLSHREEQDSDLALQPTNMAY